MSLSVIIFPCGSLSMDGVSKDCSFSIAVALVAAFTMTLAIRGS